MSSRPHEHPLHEHPQILRGVVDRHPEPRRSQVDPVPYEHAVRADIGGGPEIGHQFHRMLGDQLVGGEARQHHQVDLALQQGGGAGSGAPHERDRERCARLLEGAAQAGRQPLVPARVGERHGRQQGPQPGQPPQDGAVRTDQEGPQVAARGRGDRPGVLQQLEGGLDGSVPAAQLLGEVAHTGQAGVRLVMQEQDGQLPGGEAVACEEAVVEVVHGSNSKQDSGY